MSSNKILFIIITLGLHYFCLVTSSTQNFVVKSQRVVILVSPYSGVAEEEFAHPVNWSNNCFWKCWSWYMGALICPYEDLFYRGSVEAFMKYFKQVAEEKAAGILYDDRPCLETIVLKLPSISFVMEDNPGTTVDVKIPSNFVVDTYDFFIRGRFGISLTAGTNSDIMARRYMDVVASEIVDVNVGKLTVRGTLRINRTDTKRELLGLKKTLKPCPETRIRVKEAMIWHGVVLSGFDHLVTGLEGSWRCLNNGVVVYIFNKEKYIEECDSFSKRKVGPGKLSHDRLPFGRLPRATTRAATGSS